IRRRHEGIARHAAIAARQLRDSGHLALRGGGARPLWRRSDCRARHRAGRPPARDPAGKNPVSHGKENVIETSSPTGHSSGSDSPRSGMPPALSAAPDAPSVSTPDRLVLDGISLGYESRNGYRAVVD